MTRDGRTAIFVIHKNRIGIGFFEGNIYCKHSRQLENILFVISIMFKNGSQSN